MRDFYPLAHSQENRKYGAAGSLTGALLALMLLGTSSGATTQRGFAEAAIESCTGTTQAMRAYPFPFGNAFSFASDVDGQKPQEGAIFHNFANRKYGMPLGDSLWIQALRKLTSSFFNSRSRELNDMPVPETELPTYFHLLREWYRGNADHVHSWQDGHTPVFEFLLEKPIIISDQPKSGSTLKEKRASDFKIPFLMRVYSKGPLGKTAEVQLTDAAGKTLAVTVAEAHMALELPGNYPVDTHDADHVYEFDLLDPDGDGISEMVGIDLDTLTSSKFVDPACSAGCETEIIFLEFTAFSRKTVESQTKWLKDHNILPNYITSHGGFDIAQDYGYKHDTVVISSELIRSGGFYKKTKAPEGNLFGSPNYHADLLRSLGTELLWPIEGVTHVPPTSPLREFIALPNAYSYLSVRTLFIYGATAKSAEQLIEEVTSNIGNLDLSAIEEKRLQSAFCGPSCLSQGDGVAQIAELSLIMMARRRGIEHFWYTHFSSGGDRKFKRTKKQPFRPQTYHSLANLAAAYHGWDKSFPMFNRPWVTAAGTWARYWLVRSQIASHVSVDEAASTVRITHWEEPQIKRTMPDADHPESDLHGITIYVADPAVAKIFVGDKSITSFVRNPPDDCGRASVTVVDPYTRTSLADSRRDKMGIAAADGGFSFEAKPDQALALNAPYLRLESDLPVGSMTELTVEIESEGGIVAASTCKGDACPAQAGRVISLPVASLGKESPVTIALFQGEPRDNGKACTAANQWKGCALVSGRVSRVTVSGKLKDGVVNKEGLPVSAVRLLRPNPQIVAQTRDEVIGGQVIAEGPVPYAQARLISKVGEESRTSDIDAGGAFLFTGVKKDQLVSIELQSANGVNCAPTDLSNVLVERSTLDLDTTIAQSCVGQKSAANAALSKAEWTDFLKWFGIN